MVRRLGYLGHWEHGFANAGDPETGRLGEPNGRLVLRSASRRFLQHVPPLHLAVPALSAVHDLPGKKKRKEKASVLLSFPRFAQLFILKVKSVCFRKTSKWISQSRVNLPTRVRRVSRLDSRHFREKRLIPDPQIFKTLF